MNSLDEIFQFPNLTNLEIKIQYPSLKKDNIYQCHRIKQSLLNRVNENKPKSDFILKTLIEIKETFSNSNSTDEKGLNSNFVYKYFLKISQQNISINSLINNIKQAPILNKSFQHKEFIIKKSDSKFFFKFLVELLEEKNLYNNTFDRDDLKRK